MAKNHQNTAPNKPKITRTSQNKPEHDEYKVEQEESKKKGEKRAEQSERHLTMVNSVNSRILEVAR